jgi:thioredoxin 1
MTSLAQIRAVIEDAASSSSSSSSSDGGDDDQALVVLDFASRNCPPCEMIKPVYDGLSVSIEFVDRRVVFCAVNVSDHPDVAEYYGVDGWPTFLFFRGGVEVDRMVGGRAAKEGLYGLISKHSSR